MPISELHRREGQMTAQDQVDTALANYNALSLQGLSLGQEIWSDFIAETGLIPDAFGQVDYGGVPVSRGIEGIKYIVGD